jgi:hypothetical protein
LRWAVAAVPRCILRRCKAAVSMTHSSVRTRIATVWAPPMARFDSLPAWDNLRDASWRAFC